MKPPVTSNCSLAPKLLFVDWLKILANEKQAVRFRSPVVLVCEQKRCSHMPGSQFDRVNKFVEAHSYHFTPLNSLYDSITDTDDDSDLVANVDPDTLIRIVRTELKNGKARGIDNVYNIILKKAIGTGFYKVLARAFTISLKLGFIPHVWKIAVLCMLIKPDKPPSQTTSYRPISLLSAIMKLFERVIEKRLRKHLEDNGFFSKYQSGFRKSKSTNDHLFRLSQTIMESFNRGEHVIAAFLDVEKAFDNVWHNGLRYKIYQLDLPTKLCRWLLGSKANAAT